VNYIILKVPLFTAIFMRTETILSSDIAKT